MIIASPGNFTTSAKEDTMRNPKYTAFGKLVKIAGVNQGETLEHWARRVGICPTMLSMIIRKKKKKYVPRIDTIMKILEGFDSKEMREEALRIYLDEVKANMGKK